MIDREKVIKELEKLCKYLFHEYKICFRADEEDTYNRLLTAKNALNLLKEQKTIVRCNECKNFDEYYVECNKGHDPKPPYNCWFCADGKRRESEMEK